MSEESTTLTSEKVKEKAIDLGFSQVGIAVLDRAIAQQAAQGLQNWLAQGYHADMDWMANPKRQDIRVAFPQVASIISLSLNYYTPYSQPQASEYGKISRYAWGRDYHRVIGKKLKVFTAWLQEQGQDIQLKAYVDTGPVQDKLWAETAGLGWVGKNGNLITRRFGSWVFLAEILTNLTLEPDKPHTEHCGTCVRCIQACPTGAIAKPFVVDANRCIAYHTIENRAEELPEAIAKHLNGWVAGCDICQDVCPWNQRFSQPTAIEEFHPYPENLAPKLIDLANLSEQEWDRRFRASALRRIKPPMWRRNARANIN
ncbi:MAG: tRNA epoxyqueuosine(34) reductase QueG [Roseofilum sp. SBFL]|uniref:tRNA epoxyqueuosine(34) reductase QueG n=1 Tax=unclassified Roseofilum TaxID=2620099 RepID=UPI001B20A38C|nr:MULTISPECIES: tRNA epoxyqueuosine(34) reductase QueG [unclassified Roseofilum]MBP0012238.1 tRNA epoxyqueuosine(34) reductase QueG [Roseofilum sp. SID3]MBP0025032.1 tRNA epoxyqueuosine(34) reductase QueG [Roseofilum sp. SID2]MBP0036752.1 tRNA epoxyqueuosine(34) reductase QueG [Roseofilum sp. SID1]MBP0041694.1 tRNA epoxyqueuosine(34) reductase QueG [Roseofilum sp. SBFL]